MSSIPFVVHVHALSAVLLVEQFWHNIRVERRFVLLSRIAQNVLLSLMIYLHKMYLIHEWITIIFLWVQLIPCVNKTCFKWKIMFEIILSRDIKNINSW